MNSNNVQGLPPAGPPPQNHNGSPGFNFQMPALDLRTIEDLCQPTMNERGGPITPVNIQATDFGLKNCMIQQVQKSCQFHGLPGDDANKHLDKFLSITQSMKQNGIIDDTLRLYLFPYYLTHIATAWFDCLPKNFIHTLQEMALKFLSKYFPPSIVTKLRNDITYRGESSSSITSSSSEIAALFQQMVKMRKDMLQMYRSNQQVNSVTPTCETCDGLHSYFECQVVDGYTQDIYATTGTYNSGGNSYQSQGNRNILSYRSNNLLNHPILIIKIKEESNLTNEMAKIKKVLFQRPQGALPRNTQPNPTADIKASTTQSGIVLDGPLVPPPPIFSFSFSNEVERDLETITDQKKLMLPELIPTRMTFELANRSIAYPVGIAKDVFVQVGKLTFPVDFVVFDYNVDPRVPLILGRPFLRTAHTLVDVYGEELILRDDDENLIFHAHSTSKHPHKHGNESINMINFIDITCEDRFPEVLKIKKSNHPFSDSPLLLLKDKIKDSNMKILIDELESPESNVLFPQLLECDSTLHEELPEIDTLPSFPFGNEDKVFNPGILVYGSTNFVTN
nr:reverse transcriptase domain-containing protein [Tanacetum cinerariifolium]